MVTITRVLREEVAEEARIEAAKREAAERAAPPAGRRRRRGPDRFAPGQAPTDGRAVASSLRRGRLGVVRKDVRGIGEAGRRVLAAARAARRARGGRASVGS